MDKDDLLRRAHNIFSDQHESYSLQHHLKGECSVCDLLREIDKSLKPVDQVCDCYPAVQVCCTVDCPVEARGEGLPVLNHECKCTCSPKDMWSSRPVD